MRPGPLPWPILKKGDKVEIVSLKKRTDLNGTHGEIVNRDSKTKLYRVLLANQKKVRLSVQKENLRQLHDSECSMKCDR